MAYDQTPGTASLRAEYVDSAIKGTANRLYKFKQALRIESTGAWKNSYYQEQSNPLSAAGGMSTKVPRGAEPRQASAVWQRQTAYIEKFFFEDVIFWEDVLTDEINIQSRTLYKIAEAVTKSVDDAIFAVLSDNCTASTTSVTNIQLVTIATGKHWTGSSAAIVDDILNALTLIASSNYDTSNCMMFINPRDRRSIANYIAARGNNWTNSGNKVALNGFVGEFAGVNMIVSNSVVASHALVVVPQICGTWREAVSFRTTTIENPYVSLKIRAVEEGVTELTDPQAVVLISNTRGNDD